MPQRNSVRLRKRKIKEWFEKYKSKLSCSICGENHPATIDFHHKGDKENQVAQMVHWGIQLIIYLKKLRNVRSCVLIVIERFTGNLRTKTFKTFPKYKI